MRGPILAYAAVGTAAGLTLAACNHAGEKVDAPAPIVVTQTVRYLPDCEDVETVPCVTLDESQWREVTSYHPYQFKALAVCDVEDYPTNTPCVWKKQYAGTAAWVVYTH